MKPIIFTMLICSAILLSAEEPKVDTVGSTTENPSPEDIRLDSEVRRIQIMNQINAVRLRMIAIQRTANKLVGPPRQKQLDSLVPLRRRIHLLLVEYKKAGGRTVPAEVLANVPNK